MDGWILIHRTTIDWEWFTDVNTAHLFQYILLAANYSETKWRGRKLAPGQLLTGRKKLAEKTGLSEQNVRTSLSKLKSTGELTITKYNKYSVITVTNWKQYQTINQQLNLLPTSNQPGTNQVLTTSKEDKENKVGSVVGACPLPYQNLPTHWKHFCADEMKWTLAQMESAWLIFRDNWLDREDNLRKNWFLVFKNSCRNGYTKPNINLRGNNSGNSKTTTAQPSATDRHLRGIQLAISESAEQPADRLGRDLQFQSGGESGEL